MTKTTTRIVVIACLAMLLARGGPAAAQDTQDTRDTRDTRRAAALRYLSVTPMAKMLDDGVTELAKQVPEDRRAAFVTQMRGALRAENLERLALDAMVKTFTTEELNAIADFYGSPLGKSAMGKFGIYLAEITPAVQQEMLRALQQTRSK